MLHLDDDTLAAIAIGDSDAADATHLEQCPTCAAELEQLRELLRVMSASQPAAGLEAPPARVWDAIRVQVANERTGAAEQTVEPPNVDPELSASGVDELAQRRARRLPAWAMLASAAAGVIVGGVAVGAVLSSGNGGQAQVVAAAPLTDLETEAPAGDAVLHTRDDGTRVLVVDADTPDVDDAFLEVWLIDESIEGMVSLGHLTSGSGEFEIPAGFDVGGFPIVDISVEPFDGVPTHSGNSVTRGVLDV